MPTDRENAMSMDDLDRLKQANQERIKALEEKFFHKKQE